MKWVMALFKGTNQHESVFRPDILFNARLQNKGMIGISIIICAFNAGTIITHKSIAAYHLRCSLPAAFC